MSRYRTYDDVLAVLEASKSAWTTVPVAERIALLEKVRQCTMPVAEAWADTAASKKEIPAGSPLAGEEWLSGPYALISYCNSLIRTLSKVEGKKHLKGMPLRELPSGQLAARVMPQTLWDRILLAGVRADVWMQPGVTRHNLASHTATAYEPAGRVKGKVALVLGAGNIASIAPLDAMHKLFAENQVVVVKMNPVNEYLTEFLEPALRPLIERGFLRIVRGDIRIGQYLCTHPLVEEIHITGSGAAHDQIVWGGQEGKADGKPRNTRRITSELGAVCPTIVVPGPWSTGDIAFQAEHVATQKLHNAGFNCIACQMLILPQEWKLKSKFQQQLRKVVSSAAPRGLYYPGAADRISKFGAGLRVLSSERCLIGAIEPAAGCAEEVFGPALGVTELPGADAGAFLVAAVEYANNSLHGTLGANILIHPKTMRQIGRKRFEEIIAGLRYGCIAINAWTGLGFLLAPTPWGAFPGHTLEDVQSGIGVVHNTMLFERPERTVLEAPFRPFPRPPWFITHRRAHVLGRLITEFQHRPGIFKLPRIFFNALRG